jgi:hypothetical protein
MRLRILALALAVTGGAAELGSAAPLRVMSAPRAAHVQRNAAEGDCPASPSGSGILADGDFSQAIEPSNGGAFGLRKGTVFAPDWIVTGPRTVDFYGFSIEWSAPNGVCSVDLDGSPGPGGIRHALFPTRRGAAYTVSFLFSGNGGGAPTVKQMTVSVDRSQVMAFSWNTAGSNDAQNGNWTLETWQFRARHQMSSLHFESTDPRGGNNGPIVAAISVTKD